MELLHVAELPKQGLGRRVEKRLLPMQGDVLETFTVVDGLMRDIDFRPHTKIEEGIAKFVAWYRDYHGI